MRAQSAVSSTVTPANSAWTAMVLSARGLTAAAARRPVRPTMVMPPKWSEFSPTMMKVPGASAVWAGAFPVWLR